MASGCAAVGPRPTMVRYLQGFSERALLLAAQKAGDKPAIKALTAQAGAELTGLVQLEQLDEFHHVYGLQFAHNEAVARARWEQGATTRRQRDRLLKDYLRNWRPQPGCTVRRGRPGERVVLYPTHFPLRPAGPLKEIIGQVRGRLDRAALWVITCPDGDTAYALDPVGHRIVAWRSVPKPDEPASGPDILPDRFAQYVPTPGQGPGPAPKPVSVTLRLSCAQPGARAVVRGKTHDLPATLTGLIPRETIRGTVSAPGYHPVRFWRRTGKPIYLLRPGEGRPAGARLAHHFMLVKKE